MLNGRDGPHHCLTQQPDSVCVHVCICVCVCVGERNVRGNDSMHYNQHCINSTHSVHFTYMYM